MDSNSVVIKYLNGLGYNVGTEYYKFIKLWGEWYKNYVDKFHEYRDQNGEKREIYKLGMAKRLPEDWSSIIYTERDEIVCDNKKNQDYLNEQLKMLNFNDILPDNIETAFWSGTVGTITRIKNAKVVGKQIVADENTTYKLVNVNASQIVPLKIEDGDIVNVAFVSESLIDNKKAYYVEIHELINDKYRIQNVYLNDKGERIKKEGVVDEYYINSAIPMFNLLSPRIVNNIDDNNGLGLSIYANSIDQLKGCDINYNNFVMDFYLGGKKVFYNKKLTRTETRSFTDNETGETVEIEEPIYPDDITKQQFQVVGDPIQNINDNTLIQEHNPDLRIDDNEKGINLALNMLAFKCGLGKSYYKFDVSTGTITATQAILDNKDLVSNAKKHRSALNKYVVGIARNILYLGRVLFKNESLDELDNINLIDKDGFMISEEDLKQQYIEEIASGLRKPWEYRVKFFGEDEETAKKMTDESNEPADNEDEDV